MNTYLLIELGNTHLKWMQVAPSPAYRSLPTWADLMQSREAKPTFGQAAWPSKGLPKAFQSFLSSLSPNALSIWLASVQSSARTQDLIQLLSERFSKQIHLVRPQPKAFGLTCTQEHCKTLGVDRWLQMLAGFQKSLSTSGKPPRGIMVLSTGTAWTMEWLDPCGLYLGGLILPSRYTALKALLDHTQIPSPEAKERFFSPTQPLFAPFSNPTLNAMDAGYRLMIQSLIACQLKRFENYLNTDRANNFLKSSQEGSLDHEPQAHLPIEGDLRYTREQYGVDIWVCGGEHAVLTPILDQMALSYHHEPHLLFEGLWRYATGDPQNRV